MRCPYGHSVVTAVTMTTDDTVSIVVLPGHLKQLRQIIPALHFNRMSDCRQILHL
jgi:hypothetical protein|tara:strand:+ start:207 stop:371 length:165 start_codon:yes stop_codon:yes gene_type:complete